MTASVDGDGFATSMRAVLRTVRKERGWTQADLAARTDGAVTKAALAGYEIGHRSLRLSTFWILARALGYSCAELTARAERTMEGRGPHLRIRVQQVLHTTDPALQPVRTWLRSGYPQGAAALSVEPLPDGAVTALANLMGVAPDECRRRLSHFDADQIGVSTTRHAQDA